MSSVCTKPGTILDRTYAFSAHRTVVFFLVLSLGLVSCRTMEAIDEPVSDLGKNERDALIGTLPPVPREFRAAWVATVDNIDWPSMPELSTDQQKDELLRIMDRAQSLHLNAIVFQVRPTADAFFSSPFEPWSAYLTGEQGKAPSPFYDPLAFAVEEAHRRGIELHAWFNPFRAYHPTADSVFSDLHASAAGRTVPYGTQLWMDPGREDVVSASLQVIFDVVDRYDIDGVHLDDYFYPYPAQVDGRAIPFPDSDSWGGRGDSLARAGWRRENVDRFVERLYRGVKERKKWVKVGISPFGIWKPGHPDGVTGFDPVEKIYADARRWLQQGWVDYFSPQLYWSLESKGQNYADLLNWWIEQNTHSRHIWPGLFSTRVILEDRRHWPVSNIIDQVRFTQHAVGATGNIHFSMKSLMDTPAALGDSLASEVYSSDALVPESPWLDGATPEALIGHVEKIDGHFYVVVQPPESGSVARVWTLRTSNGESWQTRISPGWRLSVDLGRTLPVVVAVSAVSRTGSEGPITFVSKRAARLAEEK